MIDIRTIRESEGEAYLRLLCDVFSLDFNLAYSIFFSEPMFDLSRKWALFEGSEIVSVLTTTPLIFGWGRAVGIAGVATRKARRREGLAGLLLEKVLKESTVRGEGPALLFAQTTELYGRYGFEPLDRVIRADIVDSRKPHEESPLPFERIRDLYGVWSEGGPDRLRRDDRRWEYWRWSGRTGYAYGDGYLCFEDRVLREAVFTESTSQLPVYEGAQWFGTTKVADGLGLTLDQIKVELYLMGRNVPGVPELFMTDQF